MKKLTHIYFLGIGGIGMSALARYFHAMGKNVCGYDKTSTKLTDELVNEGIKVHFEDDIRLIPEEYQTPSENVLIIYTPAVPNDHKEYNFFKEKTFNIKKRAEVLGMITASSYGIAVAGTHGKTTTSSLIAHILKVAGKDPSAFLGGIAKNYNTNLLLSENLKNESTSENDLVVIEADEYDRSFLTLHPQLAVITSMDADHLDIYGDKAHVEESFILFAKQVQKTLVLKKNIAGKISSDKKIITYSIDDKTADYFAENITISEGMYHYDVRTPAGVFSSLTLGLPGKHNVENSVAATAIAVELGVSEADIRKALASFTGVKRRFDYHVKTSSLVYIDDYAHHPEELKATISSAKEMYPGKKVTGIFQPHLFSRTRDFADDFATSLDLLDECILLEIYPARELPIEGVNSQMLVKRMKSHDVSICSKKELVEELKKRKIEVLLTMGAGDIDTMIEPITKAMVEK